MKPIGINACLIKLCMQRSANAEAGLRFIAIHNIIVDLAHSPCYNYRAIMCSF